MQQQELEAVLWLVVESLSGNRREQSGSMRYNVLQLL